MFLILTQAGSKDAPVAVNIANILDIRPTYHSNPEKGATIFSAAGAGDRIHAVAVQETFSAVVGRLEHVK